MEIEEKAQQGGGQFPKTHAPVAGAHGKEETASAGKKRIKQIQAQGREGPGPVPERPQKIIDQAQGRTQAQGQPQPKQLGPHAQPKKRVQKDRASAGSS